MTKGKLVRNLGLATGLLLAFAGSAQAETDSKAAKARQAYPLSDSTKFVVQGRRDGVAASRARPDGADCQIPQPSLSLAPRERAIELRQLSVDPRTCRATFERGVPPKGSERSNLGKPVSSGTSRRGPEASGVQASANGYRYGGYARAWYVDARTNKPVTQVFSGADWDSSGGCIGESDLFYNIFASTDTGWSLVSRRWGRIDDNCSSLVSSVNAQLTDNYFTGCPGYRGRVNSYYSRVRFVGYPDGTFKGGRESRNEPTCRNGLIANFALYRR